MADLEARLMVLQETHTAYRSNEQRYWALWIGDRDAEAAGTEREETIQEARQMLKAYRKALKSKKRTRESEEEEDSDEVPIKRARLDVSVRQAARASSNGSGLTALMQAALDDDNMVIDDQPISSDVVESISQQASLPQNQSIMNLIRSMPINDLSQRAMEDAIALTAELGMDGMLPDVMLSKAQELEEEQDLLDQALAEEQQNMDIEEEEQQQQPTPNPGYGEYEEAAQLLISLSHYQSAPAANRSAMGTVLAWMADKEELRSFLWILGADASLPMEACLSWFRLVVETMEEEQFGFADMEYFFRGLWTRDMGAYTAFDRWLKAIFDLFDHWYRTSGNLVNYLSAAFLVSVTHTHSQSLHRANDERAYALGHRAIQQYYTYHAPPDLVFKVVTDQVTLAAGAGGDDLEMRQDLDVSAPGIHNPGLWGGLLQAWSEHLPDPPLVSDFIPAWDDDKPVAFQALQRVALTLGANRQKHAPALRQVFKEECLRLNARTAPVIDDDQLVSLMAWSNPAVREEGEGVSEEEDEEEPITNSTTMTRVMRVASETLIEEKIRPLLIHDYEWMLTTPVPAPGEEEAIRIQQHEIIQYGITIKVLFYRNIKQAASDGVHLTNPFEQIYLTRLDTENPLSNDYFQDRQRPLFLLRHIEFPVIFQSVGLGSDYLGGLERAISARSVSDDAVSILADWVHLPLFLLLQKRYGWSDFTDSRAAQWRDLTEGSSSLRVSRIVPLTYFHGTFGIKKKRDYRGGIYSSFSPHNPGRWDVCVR
jgi:hypothetical protein